MSIAVFPELVGLLLYCLVFGAMEIGYLIGRRQETTEHTFISQLGVVQGATLGLLTFLIGFSFAGAASRYIDRVDLFVNESNAIGTAYLRAMLVPEPFRHELQDTLRQYTADRIALIDSHDATEDAQLMARVGTLHTRMWDLGMKGAATEPTLMRMVLPPLNEVIDLHSTQVSMAKRRIPTMIMTMLISVAVAAFLLMGYSNGLNRRRHLLLNGVFCAVTAISFWMTIDLDRPRAGFIQVSSQPYVDLLASMKE